jgi:hypothetical protein
LLNAPDEWYLDRFSRQPVPIIPEKKEPRKGSAKGFCMS